MRRDTKAVLVGLSCWGALLVLPALAVRLGWLPQLPAAVERVAVYAAAIGSVAFVFFLVLDMFLPRVRLRWVAAAALLLAAAAVLAGSM